MLRPFITDNLDQITELCRKHHVRRLAVYGSAVREDFDPERSDVDFLVVFIKNEAEDPFGKFMAPGNLCTGMRLSEAWTGDAGARLLNGVSKVPGRLEESTGWI